MRLGNIGIGIGYVNRGAGGGSAFVAFEWDGSQLILGNTCPTWDGELLQLNTLCPPPPVVEPLVIDKTPDNPRTSAPKVAAWYVDAEGWKGNAREDVTVTYNYDETFSFAALAAEPDCLLPNTNAGSSIGPNGYHVYQAPGTYNPTYTLRDRAGNVETFDLPEVVADDPDVFYAGTKTICYSRDTDFTGAPADSDNRTVTDGQLPTDGFAGGWDIPSNRRVLFKRGQTFVGDIRFFNRAIHVGAFGTGEQPYLNYVNVLISGGRGDQDEDPTGYVVDDVRIGSDYDASADNNWEEGVFEPPRPPEINQTAEGEVMGLVNGCTIRGFYMLRGISYLFNNEMRDWFNYGMLEGGLGVAGNVIAQPIGARKTLFSSSVAFNRSLWNTKYLAGTTPPGVSVGDEVPNRVRHGPLRALSLGGDGCTYMNFIRNGGGHGNDAHQPTIRTTTIVSPGRPFQPTFSQNHVLGHMTLDEGDDRRVARHPDALPQWFIANIFDLWDLSDNSLKTTTGQRIFDNNLFLSENGSLFDLMSYIPESESDGGPIVDRSEEIVLFRNNTVAFNNTKTDELLSGFNDVTAPQVLGLGNVVASAGNGWTSSYSPLSESVPLTELDADYLPTTGTTFDRLLYDYVLNEGPGTVLDFDEIVRSKPTKPGYKEF